MEFTVQAKEIGERIFMDKFDDGVWLSVHIHRGSASTVLTREQAQQMLDALTSLLSTNEIV